MRMTGAASTRREMNLIGHERVDVTGRGSPRVDVAVRRSTHRSEKGSAHMSYDRRLGFFVFIETNKVSETLRIQAVDLQAFIGDIREYPLFVG